jgi:ABC-type phosphate transport system auxiliary subunit
MVTEPDLDPDKIMAERDEALQGHALMVKQFEIMRREKEHGWREAERLEDQRDRLAAENAALRAAIDNQQKSLARLRASNERQARIILDLAPADWPLGFAPPEGEQ